MAYADFTYYISAYLGTAIAESDFPALAQRASAVIDRITFQRAAVDFAANTNVTAIKNAMCAVAEELQRQDRAGGADAVTSESQGRYSVSYAAHSERMKSNSQKLQDAARLYLDGTFLMFAGFVSGEYSSDSEL
jgi:hypothetical protein